MKKIALGLAFQTRKLIGHVPVIVDAKKVGLEGHSWYGKAAIVAMAYDSRFAISYVSSSGEGGAKIHRRNFGERLENVAGSGANKLSYYI